MKPECAAAVANVLGREPTKGELDSIEERIHGSMKELQSKDPVAWSQLSRESRLQAGAKLARQKAVEDVARAHSAQLRDLELKAREIENLGRVQAGYGKGKGQLNALNQRTVFSARLEGKGTSLETDVQGVQNDLMRRLDNFGGKGKFFGAIQNPAEQHALLDAIWGKDTGKPEINDAAKSLSAVLESAHQRAVDAGINIHRLENWHLPQPMAWEKVGARQSEWFNDAMNNIDRSQYIARDGSPMSESDIRDLVAASAETLGTDGANKKQNQTPGFGGRVGASRNAPRQLHWRDADAYRFMMEKYGSANNVYSLVTQHIRGLARDIATAERFGRDADTFYPQLVNKAFLADVEAVKSSDATPEQKEKDLKKLDDQKTSTLRMWDGLRRPDAPGSIPMWAKVSQNIRGIAQATLQGGFPSALPDFQMALGYMKLRGVARTRVLGNIRDGLGPTRENIKAISRLGIVVDHIDASAHRFGTEEIGSHGVKFINHAVHVAGGLRMFDRGQTHGVAASLMDMIGEHSHKTEFDKLDGPTAKMVDQYGVTKDHWDTWRAADLDKGPNGNHTMLTPDSIYSIPDEKLRPIAEQQMAGQNADYRQGAADRAERTNQENQWLQGRFAKFEELKQKAAATLDAMKARAQVKEGAAQGVHDAQAEHIGNQLARAEIENKLNRTLAAEKSMDSARGVLADVAKAQSEAEAQFRSEPGEIDAKGNPVRRPTSAAGVYERPSTDNASRAAVDAGMSIGAKIGRDRAIAEKRVRDSQKKVDQLARDNGKALSEKSQGFDQRINKTMFDLADHTKSIRDRQAKRAELDAAFEQRHAEEMDRTIRNLRSSASKQLLSTVLSETKIGARGGSGTSLRAQLESRVMSPANRGTLGHELLSWLLLLKQTPLGIAKTHMWDVPNSMDSWGAAAMYRAKFMAGSAFLGAIGIELKNILLGEDPENLFTAKGLGKIAMASGGFGMYGDFMFGDRGDHKNGTLTKVLGPGATMIEDAMNLAKNAQHTAAGTAGIGDDEDGKALPADKLGAQALQFAHSYLAPLSRIWYAKAAFNHVVYQQMMEHMAPGYSQRVEQRMAQRGQGNWWPTGQTTPERLPDFSKMAEPAQ